MDGKEGNQGIFELGRHALQANREHVDALTTHTQRLEAELEQLDKLIEAVDTIDEADLDHIGSSVTIPGAVRASAPIAAKELLSPESPFHKDALKRNRYQNFSEVHPMKPKELEALAEAVRAESYRKHALDIQKRGLATFPDVDAHTLSLDAEDIDWDRIAEKVSAISMTTRTARECEVRWIGEQHPRFNHEPWSKEEVMKVKSIAAEFAYSQLDWVTVAERLGTRRTPLDCMRHAISRKVHQWTTDTDERLLKAIRMYGHDNWHLVARYVSEDATPSQCSSRFEKTLDESIKHTAWSPEEDARLSAAVAAYGSSWVDVAANVPGRHNDQCRDRWTEQLNPGINRSHWSKEEDQFLLDSVRGHENPPWKEISECLRTGRTEVMCRSRYTILQKGTSAVRAMSAVNHEVRVSSVDQTPVSSNSVLSSPNTYRFKPSFPDVNTGSAAPTSPHTENRRPNRLVFLEPVVSSNPESHKHHKSGSSQSSRFKPMAGDGIPFSNSTIVPPSKKRKTRSHTAKTKIPAKEAQQEFSS